MRKGSDKRITAALAPKREDTKDGEEVKPTETQMAEVRDSNTQAFGSAEPISYSYHQQLREPLSSRIIIGGCGATPPGGFRAAVPKF